MGKINSFAEECEAVWRGAGLFKAEAWGQIAVSGADAPSFLHRMLSNEVQKSPVGEGRYHGLLDRKAMTLSLFYLLRLGEQEFLAITPPQLGEKTAALLTKMKFIEKVTIRDVSGEKGLLQVIGPKADAVLKDILSFAPLKANQSQSLEGDLLIWLEDLFEVPFISLSGPKEKLAAISQGLSTKTPVLNENTVRLLKMRRVFPEYGVDLEESHILLEAGVPYAYQRQKGCYPGQEVVERILAYGKGRTPKRLCGLRVEGEVSLEKGSEILAPDGGKAGHVTSAMYDPLEKETVVLGYLDNKFVEGAKKLKFENGKLVIQYPPEPVSPPTFS